MGTPAHISKTPFRFVLYLTLDTMVGAGLLAGAWIGSETLR